VIQRKVNENNQELFRSKRTRLYEKVFASQQQQRLDHSLAFTNFWEIISTNDSFILAEYHSNNDATAFLIILVAFYRKLHRELKPSKQITHIFLEGPFKGLLGLEQLIHLGEKSKNSIYLSGKNDMFDKTALVLLAYELGIAIHGIEGLSRTLSYAHHKAMGDIGESFEGTQERFMDMNYHAFKYITKTLYQNPGKFVVICGWAHLDAECADKLPRRPDMRLNRSLEYKQELQQFLPLQKLLNVKYAFPVLSELTRTQLENESTSESHSLPSCAVIVDLDFSTGKDLDNLSALKRHLQELKDKYLNHDEEQVSRNLKFMGQQDAVWRNIENYFMFSSAEEISIKISQSLPSILSPERLKLLYWCMNPEKRSV